MLLERLFENLALKVEAFATCLVAPGWRLCLPALDWVTLHFVLEGEGSLRDADRHVRPIAPDSLVVVPPRLLHAIQCGELIQSETTAKSGAAVHTAGLPGDAKLNVACGRVQVTYGVSLGLFDQLRDVLLLDFSDHPQMRATFGALLDEQRTGGPGGEVMMSALMSQCLVQVFRRLSTHPAGKLPWLVALDDPSLGRAVDAILAHPERPHTVESLAAAGHVSRSAFAKRFRDSFGRPPMDYVREVRLRRGAQILRRDQRLTVDDVAGRVGFASRSQFSHAFHEYFGQSPGEFRAGSG